MDGEMPGRRGVNIKEIPRAHIWSPRALIGKDLLPRENVMLTLRNRRIVSVNYLSRAEIPRDMWESRNFFCLKEGTTLLSGLVDAHVHVALDGSRATSSSLKDEGGEKTWENVKEDALSFLNCGVTLVRDGGDRQFFNLKVKEAVERKALFGPQVVATGEALYRKGNYGSFLGVGFKGKEELALRLEKLFSQGIDQLKILLSGIVSFKHYGRVGRSDITIEELSLIVNWARERRIKVMAHASSGAAVDMALRAGVDSVEHGYFLTRSNLERMAFQGTTWVPTVIPVAVQVREPWVYQWTPRELEVIRRTYLEHMEKLNTAVELGVPLGVGTDSGARGVNPGQSLLEEMNLFMEAGLSPHDTLRSATAVGGAVAGKASTGILEVNRDPFLIVVKGDPLQDLEAFQRVERVFL